MVLLGSTQHFTHLCLAGPLALRLILTSSNHLLDLDAGHVNLLGKLSDSLIGILIGKGVNVNLHPGSNYREKRRIHEDGLQAIGRSSYAGISQIGCTLDSLSAVPWYLSLPHENAGEPHELDAQDSCLSPSSLIMFKLLSSSFFPLLLLTAQPCPGLQHYCNSFLAGLSASALFSPSCSVFLEQYVHCLPPHLRAFPITSSRVKSKLCLLFRTLQEAGQTSRLAFSWLSNQSSHCPHSRAHSRAVHTHHFLPEAS